MAGESPRPHEALPATDPVMARLVDSIGELSIAARRRGRPRDAYGTLLRSVIGQQLSTKAAATIYSRVLGLFDGRVPSPAELLAADAGELRATGLSGRKVSYVRDLATQVEAGDLELERISELSDEEVVAEITAVRGFGVWSAQMFLIFHLERPDVLPTGDLGVRRAVERAYGLDSLPSATELERIAAPWRPHRSLASLYLWESLASAPVD